MTVNQRTLRVLGIIVLILVAVAAAAVASL